MAFLYFSVFSAPSCSKSFLLQLCALSTWEKKPIKLARRQS